MSAFISLTMSIHLLSPCTSSTATGMAAFGTFPDMITTMLVEELQDLDHNVDDGDRELLIQRYRATCLVSLFFFSAMMMIQLVAAVVMGVCTVCA